jgi:hypothetical protein
VKQRSARSVCALALLMMPFADAALAQEARISAPFKTQTSLGLQTFQEAIASVGFHCPVVQLVTTEIDKARGAGLPQFIYKVHCRELGSLDVNPTLIYRVEQVDAERRFSIRRW